MPRFDAKKTRCNSRGIRLSRIILFWVDEDELLLLLLFDVFGAFILMMVVI